MPFSHRSTWRRRAPATGAGLTLLVAVASPGVASANTSHDGWPRINGMLLMNKLDQSRPLDAVPGHDPFGGQDPTYRCDGLHTAGSGNDYIKAHYGHGTIDCGGGRDVLYISRKAQRHYRIARCETVSHRTLGY